MPRPLTERRRRKGFESGSGQTRLRFGQQGHDGCPSVARVGHELEADSPTKNHRFEPDRVAEGFNSARVEVWVITVSRVDQQRHRRRGSSSRNGKSDLDVRRCSRSERDQTKAAQVRAPPP